jgi:hypothetical protein
VTPPVKPVSVYEVAPNNTVFVVVREPSKICSVKEDTADPPVRSKLLHLTMIALFVTSAADMVTGLIC